MATYEDNSDGTVKATCTKCGRVDVLDGDKGKRLKELKSDAYTCYDCWKSVEPQAKKTSDYVEGAIRGQAMNMAQRHVLAETPIEDLNVLTERLNKWADFYYSWIKSRK